jgi:hypothetical protein
MDDEGTSPLDWRAIHKDRMDTITDAIITINTEMKNVHYFMMGLRSLVFEQYPDDNTRYHDKLQSKFEGLARWVDAVQGDLDNLFDGE